MNKIKEIEELTYKLIVFKNEYLQMNDFLYFIKLEELLNLTNKIINILNYNKCNIIHYKNIISLYENLNKIKTDNKTIKQNCSLEKFIDILLVMSLQYHEIK